MPVCIMTADSMPETHKIAIIGANGMLARMVRERAPRNCTLHQFDLPDFDLRNRCQVLEVLQQLSPDVIVNCAAFTNVDGAESAQEEALSINGTAVSFLAEAAKVVNATLVHVSTDYVFDGTKGSPYIEVDDVNPQSTYGRSKLLGEQSIRASDLREHFIVRTSWLYGPGGNNFVETILRLAREREELRIIQDQVGSPTYTADLADAIYNLLGLHSKSRASSPCPYGIYHFSDAGSCSWYEFACAIVEEGRFRELPIKTREIYPIKTEEYPLPAVRPANSVFDKTKYKGATGAKIPAWKDSLQTYFSVRDQS